MSADDELRKQTRIMIETKADRVGSYAGVVGLVVTGYLMAKLNDVVELPAWANVVLVVAGGVLFMFVAARIETARLSK